MAVVKIYTASDSRSFDFYGFFDKNPTFTNRTTTSYTIVQDGNASNHIDIQGSDFAYIPDDFPSQYHGAPYQGTTNAAQSFVNGMKVSEISGLSITQDQAQQYIESNDPRAVEMDIFKGADTVTGSKFVDYIEGFAGNDVIDSGAGNDTLDGGVGNDTLDGGVGLDKMTGDLGNDIYYVDNAGDTVTELAGKDSGTDIVRTTLNTYTLSANVEQVVFQGTGAFTGTGNASDNRFTGGIGDDKFFTDGTGKDTFGGGSGSDSVFYTTAKTGAVIDLSSGGQNAGAAAGDVYGSIEKFFGSNTAGDTMTAGAGRVVFAGQGGNDTLTGGNTVDQLLGGAGNDKLKGMGGVDLLQGGLGNDTMDGGTGADQFLFVEAKFGQDTVQNFEDKQDRLKIYSAVAHDITDFTIAGNDTAHVTLTLNADHTNVISLDAAATIHITAANFLFY